MLLYAHRTRTHIIFHTAAELSARVQVLCCFASTETIGTIKDGEPRTVTSFTQLLGSEMRLVLMLLYVHSSWALKCALIQSRLTSVHSNHKDYNIRDGEPRMATSSFTQVLGSEMRFVSMLLFVKKEKKKKKKEAY